VAIERAWPDWAGARSVHNWFAIKEKSSKDLHCQQAPRLREKELDDEDSQSIQKGSVKPVSVSGFMTFLIS
jgi:hypothetical protein